MKLIFILRKGTSKKYFQVKREELPKNTVGIQNIRTYKNNIKRNFEKASQHQEVFIFLIF
jgi:hypothetical protein